MAGTDFANTKICDAYSILKILSPFVRTSPQIGYSSEEQMDLILKFVQGFDVHNLLFALRAKKMDESSIRSLTLDISDYNNRLERQKLHLFDFGKDFNKMYATDNNKCFDTALIVTRKIKSGIAEAKRLFVRFCVPSRKRLPDGITSIQAHERSLINTQNYVIDLFGLKSFPDYVADLFYTMIRFYQNLQECIEECIRVIKQENFIRQDKRKCMELLLEACDKSIKQQAHIIEAIAQNPKLKQVIIETEGLSSDALNPVFRDYENIMKDERNASDYFHKWTPKDVNKITIKKACLNENDSDLAWAYTLFGEDKEKIQRINYIIEHFDSVLTPKCKKNKIPAMYLLFFMEWCGNKLGVESFLNYFEKIYKSHEGLHDMILRSAITGARRKYLKSKGLKEEQKAFVAKLDSIINAHFSNDIVS